MSTVTPWSPNGQHPTSHLNSFLLSHKKTLNRMRYLQRHTRIFENVEVTHFAQTTHVRQMLLTINCQMFFLLSSIFPPPFILPLSLSLLPFFLANLQDSLQCLCCFSSLPPFCVSLTCSVVIRCRMRRGCAGLALYTASLFQHNT